MSDGEEKRKKKGLFGRPRLKKKGSRSDLSQDESSFGGRDFSIDGDSTVNSEQVTKKKKKKGLGKRIKRMVVGRKKKKKDDDGSDMDVFDKDDPNYRGPRTSLHPDILKQVMEGDDGGEGTRRGGRFGIEDAIDEEGEEDQDMEIMSYGEAEVGSEVDEPGDLMFPVSLVLLLVDPDTLRFELLQLEFDTPQEAKVGDVLEQIKDSITEPAIRSLEFHSLVDRKGGLFSATAPLAKALTNRKRSKDILAVLSKGVTTEQCGKLARPIFGDAKVITMLEANGYTVKGWAKNKQEESELRDTKPDTFAVSERKRQLRFTTMLLGALLVAYLAYSVFQYFFGPAPLAALEESSLNSTSVNVTEAILNHTEEIVQNLIVEDVTPEVVE